ncbi:MAG: TetR/AcrR family transcriptional regulator [Actinobacteria bacterium]|nr:TetR/AcrR family transcriptional regulator [Actinomycetota bacterium]
MRLATKRKRVLKSPEDRRAEILDAATRVFCDKGVSGATVAEIAEAAGVAKGTVYLYFGSKEHLLVALRDRFTDQLLEHVSDLLSRVGQDDWWGLVDATIESMVDFMIGKEDLMRVFLEEGLSSDVAKVVDVGSRVDSMFAAAIQMGIEAGACKVTDPELMASFFHHALEGYMLHACLHGDAVDRDRFVAAAKELVHKSLSRQEQESWKAPSAS